MQNKTFKNVDELKETLCEIGLEDAVVFDNPSYITAVVGVDESGRVIYDYDLMAEDLMKEDGMTYEEAMEFIDYNTIRALPYTGSMGPIILHKLDMYI